MFSVFYVKKEKNEEPQYSRNEVKHEVIYLLRSCHNFNLSASENISIQGFMATVFQKCRENVELMNKCISIETVSPKNNEENFD